MFTFDDLKILLNAKPLIPFRLHLSDGDHVDVRHREFAFPGRRYVVIGLPDAADPDAQFDRHIIVWYLHVSRAELLDSGPPPFMTPPNSPEQPAPMR